MDEPLSNLDAKLRVQTRAEIARLHQRLKTTIVYVTHDQVEAMTMGTRIAVMSEGLLQQVGTPQALYDTPVNRFVAGFIGSPAMNFVDMSRRPAPATARPSTGPATSTCRSRTACANRSVRRSGASSSPGIRPEHLEHGRRPARHRPRSRSRRMSSSTSATRSCSTSRPARQELVAVVGSEHRVRPGDIINLILPLEKLHLFDAETGAVAGERSTLAASAA